jgi:hypothetical protein
VASAQSSHPIVSAVLTNDQPVEFSGTDPITIYSSDQISFVFSNDHQAGKLYFMLEEKDAERRPEEISVAAYDQLKAGTYQFATYLEDQEGNMVPAPPITVVVKGSFMSKWWFVPMLILYLLLIFGAAVYMIMLSNFRSKEKLSELRNDWTNKLHNDIGGDLSSVSLRLQMLKRKIEPLDPKVKEGVVKTYDILSSIQKKLRFVFDLVDPKKDSLQIMLNDVRDFAEENYALKNMQFEYRNDLPVDLQHRLDIGRINKLYLVMKEVVNNSVKYANGSLASMHIAKVRSGLQIEIKDDGQGFDTGSDHNGNGLKNLKQFSLEGFIDINIDSAIGKGTTATIVVPDL